MQNTKRLTLKAVNQFLKENGVDAELVKGEGYFYFTGPAVNCTCEQGVYGVYRLNDLSRGQWLAEAKEKLVAC